MFISSLLSTYPYPASPKHALTSSSFLLFPCALVFPPTPSVRFLLSSSILPVFPPVSFSTQFPEPLSLVSFYVPFLWLPSSKPISFELFTITTPSLNCCPCLYSLYHTIIWFVSLSLSDLSLSIPFRLLPLSRSFLLPHTFPYYISHFPCLISSDSPSLCCLRLVPIYTPRSLVPQEVFPTSPKL